MNGAAGNPVELGPCSRRACGLPAQAAAILIAMVLVALTALPASAQILQRELPPPLQEVDLIQRLGEKVPLHLEFINSAGQTIELGHYFNQGKPVMIVMIYYNCPQMCPLTLERLQQALNELRFTVGEEFNVAVISFDTRNTTQMAAENKAAYLAGYNRPKTPEVLAGWEFHTATSQNARALADAIGFKYQFIPETGEYSHPSTYVIVTPEGVISRYISGLEPDVRDLRLALLEASEGRIARSIADFFLHLCFRWDPTAGEYNLHAMRMMQITGFLTVVGLMTLIAGLKAGERARAWRRAAAGKAGEEESGAESQASQGNRMS